METKTFRDSEEKSYTCPLCCKSFTTFYLLRRHTDLHLRKELYNCTVCKKSCNRLDHFIEHKLTLNAEQPKSFQNKISLNQVKNKKKPRPRSSGGLQYQCSICGKSFLQLGDLTIHKRTHTGEKPYECSQCKKAFSDPRNFKRHTMIHEKHKYVCSQCSRTFHRSDHLRYHILAHSKAPRKPVYRCHNCKLLCEDEESLKKHEATHLEHLPNICPHCYKGFFDPVDFKRHIKTHRESHKCPYCTRSFRHLGTLNIHMMSNHNESGEKLNSCPECNETFKELHSLKRHMLTHTKRQSESWSHSETKKKHASTNSEEKEFKCPECTKSFNNIATWENHVLNHKKKEISNKCTKYKESFSQLETLKRPKRRCKRK